MADIVTFEPQGRYDVILFDRVLHMLDDDGERTAVITKACNHIQQGGYILIADTPKHQPFLRNFFENHSADWQLINQKKNLLFVHKNQ